MDKKYWLLMKPNVYADFKEKQALLYDTDSGKCITLFQGEQIALVKALYEDLNLGSVEVSSCDLTDEKGACIRLLNDYGMAHLIPMDECPTKPVALVPILSLNKDVDKLMDKEEGKLLLSKDITKYLLDVNIQLTDHCPLSCSHCSGYCKQFPCCSQGREPIGQLPAIGVAVKTSASTPAERMAIARPRELITVASIPILSPFTLSKPLPTPWRPLNMFPPPITIAT